MTRLSCYQGRVNHFKRENQMAKGNNSQKNDKKNKKPKQAKKK